jgi:formyl-CoA transferase
MSITGWPDSPPTRAGTAIGDMTCALFTCVGVLSALQVPFRRSHASPISIHQC